MDHARVEQDPLGQRGLPRINMRSNPDIPSPLERILPRGVNSDYQSLELSPRQALVSSQLNGKVE